MITVEELIEKLNNIEDKSIPIYCYDSWEDKFKLITGYSIINPDHKKYICNGETRLVFDH